MLHKKYSKNYWFKKIDNIFLLKRLSLYLMIFTLLFIYMYPILIICVGGLFYVCMKCDDIGSKYICELSKQYPIEIFKDILK